VYALNKQEGDDKMPLQNLDHINVYCADLASSRSFYANVLGLRDGSRPAFGFPGAWLYIGDRPVVHLVGGRNGEAPLKTGPFDHIAFEATDFPAMRSKMQALGLDFQENDVPDFKIKQLFVRDPDGVKIELNFRG
jgi:catechol 2,3-dioxygenase-like lactoylglutathione lyase family enzyme